MTVLFECQRKSVKCITISLRIVLFMLMFCAFLLKVFLNLWKCCVPLLLKIFLKFLRNSLKYPEILLLMELQACLKMFFLTNNFSFILYYFLIDEEEARQMRVKKFQDADPKCFCGKKFPGIIFLPLQTCCHSINILV